MIMMRFSIFILFCFSVLFANAQSANVPYKDGESLTYVMNYKWGTVDTDVGEAVTSLKFEDGGFHSVITGKIGRASCRERVLR